MYLRKLQKKSAISGTGVVAHRVEEQFDFSAGKLSLVLHILALENKDKGGEKVMNKKK